MITDIRKILTEFNIPFVESGKDWQPGWLNIRCPKCDDPEYHGGFNLSRAYYNCWRCGHHKLHTVIALLLGIKEYDAIRLIRNFGTYYIDKRHEPVEKGTALKTELPKEAQELNKRQRKYLIERNFIPKLLVEKWNLKGTNHRGDYNFRIIAPIYLNSRLVSYQGRDITEQSELRYKACKIKDEVVHHKHTLYGIDYITNRRAVVVEGITDVWRLGYGSVGTFGTEFTLEQVLILAQRVDYAGILFDSGTDAQRQASKLSLALESFGIDTDIYELDSKYEDPAELSDSEASSFMRSVL